MRFIEQERAVARAVLRETTGPDEAADRASAEGEAITLEALGADAAAWVRSPETKVGSQGA